MSKNSNDRRPDCQKDKPSTVGKILTKVAKGLIIGAILPGADFFID